jgi:hypothetical protein
VHLRLPWYGVADDGVLQLVQKPTCSSVIMPAA